MGNPQDVSDAVNGIANFILGYATALAAVGALTMALMEGYKNIFRVRDNYHRRSIARWIESYEGEGVDVDGTKKAKLALLGADVRKFGDRRDTYKLHGWIYFELMHLTTGTTADSITGNGKHEHMGHTRTTDRALFSLPLEKLMGQVQDAADTALSNPAVYPYLYYFLTSGAQPTDVAEWFRRAQQILPSLPASASARQQQALKQDAKDQNDTYSRLNKFVRHRLDAFQLVTGYTWQERNQWWAIMLGAILLFIVLCSLQRARLLELAQQPDSLPLVVQVIGIAGASVIGGILAPIAKDLVVALKKVRNGG